jgi:hypothetical protein
MPLPRINASVHTHAAHVQILASPQCLSGPSRRHERSSFSPRRRSRPGLPRPPATETVRVCVRSENDACHLNPSCLYLTSSAVRYRSVRGLSSTKRARESIFPATPSGAREITATGLNRLSLGREIQLPGRQHCLLCPLMEKHPV